jgi:hypothetical protein
MNLLSFDLHYVHMLAAEIVERKIIFICYGLIKTNGDYQTCTFVMKRGNAALCF